MCKIFQDNRISFNHIARDGNALTDSIAKEGVFRSSISFDV